MTFKKGWPCISLGNKGLARNLRPPADYECMSFNVGNLLCFSERDYHFDYSTTTLQVYLNYNAPWRACLICTYYTLFWYELVIGESTCSHIFTIVTFLRTWPLGSRSPHLVMLALQSNFKFLLCVFVKAKTNLWGASQEWNHHAHVLGCSSICCRS